MEDSSSERNNERRPRLPANDRVMIQGMKGAAWTVNWSPQGVCLLSENALWRGECFEVEFPDRYSRGVASVVWARQLPDGCLAGLEFRSLERRAVLS